MRRFAASHRKGPAGEISGRPSGCPAPYGLPHGGESVWCRTKQPLKQNKQPQNRGTSDCTKKREQQSRHKPETQKVTQCIFSIGTYLLGGRVNDFSGPIATGLSPAPRIKESSYTAEQSPIDQIFHLYLVGLAAMTAAPTASAGQIGRAHV